MAYDLEEQESLEQLKAWWDKWGNLITAAITIFCLAFAGYNGWRWYERNQGAKATAAFVQLQNAVVQNDQKNLSSLAKGIMQEYPKHAFASLAAFTLARDAMDKANFADAKSALVWVIETGKRPEYETIARVRLAGVELQTKNAKEALAVLEKAKPAEGDAVIYNDRLGDVYFALGETEKARAAWKKAIAADPKTNTLAAFVSLKLESLPDAP